MKNEYVLNLDSITNLTQFVLEISSIPCDIDAIYERQIVDAKSYLGLIAISSHPIKVIINTDDEKYLQTFSTICKKYEI